MMHRMSVIAVAAAASMLCTCKREPVLPAPEDDAALFAGRDKLIAVYSANLWGELTECG